MNNFEFSGNTQTLRQRLNEGRVPVQDSLRYAAMLAESLRAIHESGRAHGGVSPESIVLTPIGIELLPAVSGAARVTPYTAPEVAAEHKPADARSDIFSFGAVLFEALTGRRAFEGDGEDGEATLLDAICAAPAPPSGNPAVDRLLVGCFAKNPADRWQNMQKIQLELKLLTASAKHNAGAATAKLTAPAAAVVAEASLRVELAQLEARVNARLAAHEQSMAQLQIAVHDAITTIRGQISAISLRVGTASAGLSSGLSFGLDAGHNLEAAAARLTGELRAEMQENIDSLSRRIAFLEQNGVGSGSASDDVQRVEAGLDRVRRDLRELHENMALDFHEFEINLKGQGAAIESARTAMAQTDELVERVVEALDNLQASILDEERMMAIS